MYFFFKLIEFRVSDSMLTDNLYLLRLLRYNRPSYLWIKEENKQLDLKKKKKKKRCLKGIHFSNFLIFRRYTDFSIVHPILIAFLLIDWLNRTFSSLITCHRVYIRVTRQAPHVEQELLTLQGHPGPLHVLKRFVLFDL